jgi:hypothetical protein
MIKGVRDVGLIPFILPNDNRDWDPKDGDPAKRPTVWMIAPQTMPSANRNMAGYIRSQGKATDDAVAEGYTKQDLNQFLRAVKEVWHYIFSDSDDPTEHLDTPEGMKRVFFDLDADNVTALMNASRNIFTLREGEKNALSSLSGAALKGSIPAGSDSTVSDASKAS